MTTHVLPFAQTYFYKGVYSKRKEFAPLGSKFFPFRIDCFSEEDKNDFYRVASPDSVPVHLKQTNI